MTGRVRDAVLYGQRGFTLLEMLAVLVIISLAIGIVYPVSYRLAEKFETRLQHASIVKEKKKQEFMAFIKDEDGSPANLEKSRKE